MNTHLLKAAAASVLALAALPAIAAPEKTPLVFDASVSDARPALRKDACKLNIMGISDERFSKDGVGVDAPVATDAPQAWIGAGLESLKAYGYAVQRSNAPVAGAVNLDVRLIRAYTWLADMRINGMVATDVTLVSPSGSKTRKFRASGSKTNMWGASAEHVTALNYALNHMVHQMAEGLSSECAGLTVAAR